MTKNNRYSLCATVLCAFTAQMMLSDFKEEQNGVAIVVEDFRSEEGEFLPFPVVSGIMNGLQMLHNKIQPIRVSIHNKSDKPVIVNMSSLPAKQVHAESILNVRDSCLLTVGFGVLGAYSSFFYECCCYGGLNDSLFSSFPVTTTWTAAVIVAVIAQWIFVKRHARQELDVFCLHNETVVQPGYKVTRAAFLDATTYSGLFRFRVLSEDKMEFVATFDVDMLGA